MADFSQFSQNTLAKVLEAFDIDRDRAFVALTAAYYPHYYTHFEAVAGKIYVYLQQ